ncbi:tRNA (guanine(46)-N(7))-methyltransferase TrmB [Temperatibacter marinus]|uniref:tRNA (guanine-N(7)-)-methyltransferase n=1 Tax=Temperatibacter marinus TaxID=1456591 RepID=A0AA52EAV1_9PROT|nr:tRNA (guanine(46)-N(7))-methyltransferase TrmB [Temperatibacter marinus]WND01350.1 tRNA (guanine(46)-N(7))-methyltransferase TrmB [Temperatibacter marinus]
MTDDRKQKSDFQRPEQRFFGRRKGNKLSSRKQELMETLLPRLMVPLDEDAEGNLDAFSLFPEGIKKIWFEIGFGKGEHMSWQARHNPDVGLIGCEPFLNGVAGLLTDIEEQDLKNIRIYSDDARHVMKALPDESVDRLFLLQPDPWPKARHARRRFVNSYNLDEISRILVCGAEFRISTDHPIYREWVNIQMSERPDFEWTAEGPQDWQNRPADWPETRYVRKALEGQATYFIFKRRPRK